MKIASIGANKMNSFQGVLKPVDSGSKVSFKGSDSFELNPNIREQNLNVNAIKQHYGSMISNLQSERDVLFDGAMCDLRSDFEKSALRDKALQYNRILKDDMNDSKWKLRNVFASIAEQFQMAFLKKEDNITSLKKALIIVGDGDFEKTNKVFNLALNHNQITGMLGRDTNTTRQSHDLGLDLDVVKMKNIYSSEDEFACAVLDEMKKADENFKKTGRKTSIFVEDAKSLLTDYPNGANSHKLRDYLMTHEQVAPTTFAFKKEDPSTWVFVRGKERSAQLTFAVSSWDDIGSKFKGYPKNPDGSVSLTEFFMADKHDINVDTALLDEIEQQQKSMQSEFESYSKKRGAIVAKKQEYNVRIDKIKQEMNEKLLSLKNLYEEESVNESKVKSLMSSIGISKEEYETAQHLTNWQAIKDGTAQVVSFTEAEVKKQSPSILTRFKNFVKANKLPSFAVALIALVGAIGLVAKNSKNKTAG